MSNRYPQNLHAYTNYTDRPYIHYNGVPINPQPNYDYRKVPQSRSIIRSPENSTNIDLIMQRPIDPRYYYNGCGF